MRSAIRGSVVTFCAVIVSACGSVPSYEPAPSSNVSGYKLGPAQAFSDLDHVHRFLNDDKTVLYLQNHGGGGVAVGLLLGPLGVLANVEMIKAQTEKDAAILKDKLSVNVSGDFSKALTTEPMVALIDSPTSALISPYLFVVNVDNDHIHFAALVVVDYGPSGSKWTRQYIYELPDVYGKSQIATGLSESQLAALSDHLLIGFQWDVRTYVLDAAGTFKPQESAKLGSDFVTPRIQIQLAGHKFDAGPGRLGFATPLAVYSLPTDSGTLSQ